MTVEPALTPLNDPMTTTLTATYWDSFYQINGLFLTLSFLLEPVAFGDDDQIIYVRAGDDVATVRVEQLNHFGEITITTRYAHGLVSTADGGFIRTFLRSPMRTRAGTSTSPR